MYPRLNPPERLRGPDSSEDKPAALARVLPDAWSPFARLSAEFGLPATDPLILPEWYTIRRFGARPPWPNQIVASAG